jgi:hypothetical protein
MGEGQEYAAVATDVPCYWWQWIQSGTQGAGSQIIMVATEEERIVFDRDEGVQPEDHITRMVDHKGRPIFDEDHYRTVESVTPERTHIDTVVRYARAAGGR